VPFFDHMLSQLGRHAGFDLAIDATGDLEIDAHHTVEDVGLALGDALKEALGDKAGINRYGSVTVPMEESLVQVALDLSGRPYLSHDVPVPVARVGEYDPALTNEFLRALTNRAGITLHVKLLDGSDPHHIVEAEFKALARALGQACAFSGRDGAPSTKGVLE
jgi:imidazoleglycerol-phosphate dehydratase